MPPKKNDPPDKEKIQVSPDFLKRMGNHLNNLKKVPTIQELCAEGAKIVEEEERSVKQKSNDLTQPKQSKPELTQADKYRTSFQQVLNTLPNWKRRTIQECIDQHNFNDRLYLEFVKIVIQTAEQ
jgi:hypothetical protein